MVWTTIGFRMDKEQNTRPANGSDSDGWIAAEIIAG